MKTIITSKLTNNNMLKLIHIYGKYINNLIYWLDRDTAMPHNPRQELEVALDPLLSLSEHVGSLSTLRVV